MADLQALVQTDVEIFSEARGVVVADGLGVAEGFQDRVAETEDIVNVLVQGGLFLVEEELQKPQTLLVGFGFAGS